MEELSQVLQDFPLRGKNLHKFATLSKTNLNLVDALIDSWVWNLLEKEMTASKILWSAYGPRLLPWIISTLVRSHREDLLDDLLDDLKSEFGSLEWYNVNPESPYCNTYAVYADYGNTNWILYMDGSIRRHINACIDAKDFSQLDLWMKIPGRDFPSNKSPLYHAITTENWEMTRYITSHPRFSNWGCCQIDFRRLEVCTKVKSCGGVIPFEYEETRFDDDPVKTADYFRTEDIPSLLELGMSVHIYAGHFSMFVKVLYRMLETDDGEERSIHMKALEALSVHGACLRDQDGKSHLEYYLRNNASGVHEFVDVIQFFTRHGCPPSPEFIVDIQKSVTTMKDVQTVQEIFPESFSLDLMVPNVLKYFTEDDLQEFLALDPQLPPTAFHTYLCREKYLQAVALSLVKHGIDGFTSYCSLVEKTSVKCADEHGSHLPRCCSENRPCSALTNSVENLERFYRPTLSDHSFPLCHRLGSLIERKHQLSVFFWFIDNRGNIPLCDACISGHGCQHLMEPLTEWLTNKRAVPSYAVLLEILKLTHPPKVCINTANWSERVWDDYRNSKEWKINVSPKDQTIWREKFETSYFPVQLREASIRRGWTWARLHREYRCWRRFYCGTYRIDGQYLRLGFRTHCVEFFSKEDPFHACVNWEWDLGRTQWVDQSNISIIRDFLELVLEGLHVRPHDIQWVKTYLESHLPESQELLDYWLSHA